MLVGRWRGKGKRNSVARHHMPVARRAKRATSRIHAYRGDMSERRTLAGLLAVTVGGCLVTSCLAVGRLPLLAGSENCVTAFQPFGEGGLRVWTDFSVLPYRGVCVFQGTTRGQNLWIGPDPLWSIGVAGRVLTALVGAGLLITRARRLSTTSHRSSVLG